MNRNQLITRFISNLANVILHKILEKAIDQEEISKKYSNEMLNSWEIAKIYREKINPKTTSLQDRDISEIKTKLVNKVKSELQIRIAKGYRNIDINLVEDFINEALKDLRII